MRKFLVVAHQTLASRELLEAMKAKAEEEETVFYLLVPIYHGEPGLTWTEGHDRAVAQRRLNEAQLRMAAEGVMVAGEVGSDNPVDSVDEVLRREGSANFAGIIVSTLPRNVSKWLKLDVPSRIQRKTTLAVDHLIGHPEVAQSLVRHARQRRDNARREGLHIATQRRVWGKAR